MTEDIRAKYKAKEILASIPSDRGRTIHRLQACRQTRASGESSFTSRPGEAAGSAPLPFGVFEIAGKHQSSVVVEVAECASARDAVEDLIETLARKTRQPHSVPGPNPCQAAAFRHRNRRRLGSSICPGNLRISIMSQSRASDDVDEWLGLIQHDLDLAPG